MMRYRRVCWAVMSTIVFWHFTSFGSAHRCRHSLAHNWIAEMVNTLFVHDLFKYNRVFTHFIICTIPSCFHSIYFVFDVATVVNIDAVSVRVFIYLFSIPFRHLFCIIFASFVKRSKELIKYVETVLLLLFMQRALVWNAGCDTRHVMLGTLEIAYALGQKSQTANSTQSD